MDLRILHLGFKYQFALLSFWPLYTINIFVPKLQLLVHLYLT